MTADDCRGQRTGVGAWVMGLVAPRSTDEDTRRREFVLTVILLLANVLWTSVLAISFAMQLMSGRFANWPLNLTFLAALLGLYGLVRQGHYLVSAWSLIMIFIGLGIPSLGSHWGTPQAPAALSGLICAMVIVLAGILLDHRSTILVATTVLAEVVGFGVHGVLVSGSRDDVWPSVLPDVLVLLFPLGLIALASLLSSSQVDKSLARARTSERDLKHERDNLEASVAARTQQLQQLQDQRLREEVARAAKEARYDERITQYRRLHDTVLSTLTALSQGGLDVHREEVRARAAREADYLRRLLMGDDTTGRGRTLHEALSEVIEDVSALGLRVDYLTDSVPADLPDTVTAALADATREALTNVLRHSGTRHAWLTSTGEPDGSVVVRIVDRGLGFTWPAAGAGLGLRRSVDDRVTEAGGSVALDSHPAEGTLVKLRWPAAGTDGAIA